MSVLNTEQTPKIEDIVTSIKNANTGLFNTIQGQLKFGFDLFWNNPDFTPQQIADAFGTDATSLFMLSYQLQEVLLATDPNYVMLTAPVQVILNSDGSVTIPTV